MQVTLLGSGSSTGVPAVGPGGWGACDPENPKNRRTRAAFLVENAGTTILVDTPPDLRQQLLREAKHQIDAVLYTHTHADHVHGIDDLRSISFHRGAALDVYAAAKDCAELQRRFGYTFISPESCAGSLKSSDEPVRIDTWRPELNLHEITGKFSVGQVDIVPFEQVHGRGASLGFRFKSVAYSTDLNALSEKSFKMLEGVDVWFVDCMREEPHRTHAHLDLTLEWIARVKPQRAILCHLSIQMDYDTIQAKLPSGVEVGYDGLSISM